MRVDQQARGQLRLLATGGPLGLIEADRILATLLRDAPRMRNTSAYLEGNIREARQFLDRPPWGHADWNSWCIGMGLLHLMDPRGYPRPPPNVTVVRSIMECQAIDGMQPTLMLPAGEMGTRSSAALAGSSPPTVIVH